MILSDRRMVSHLKELWSFKSFRARIFLAAFPTIVAIAVGHMATDRQRPYDFIAEESTVIPIITTGGQQIVVSWRINRHRSCPGFVERQIIDPETDVIVAAYDPVFAAEGDTTLGYTWLRRTFALPARVQKGNLAYQAKLTYHCNWLQKLWPAIAIRYTTPKLPFYVE